MTERKEVGGFSGGELGKQAKDPTAEYDAGIPQIEQQNRLETDKPKVKVPRRTRGRGRWIKPKV